MTARMLSIWTLSTSTTSLRIKSAPCSQDQKEPKVSNLWFRWHSSITSKWMCGCYWRQECLHLRW